MSWVLYDYVCEVCGEQFESMEQRSDVPDALPCRKPGCSGMARRAMPAPKGKVCWAWVTQGKSDPPPPGTFTTQHLARD